MSLLKTKRLHANAEETTTAKETIAKEAITKETIAKETIAKETIAKETTIKKTIAEEGIIKETPEETETTMTTRFIVISTDQIATLGMSSAKT